jgi:hypothetical protein
MQNRPEKRLNEAAQTRNRQPLHAGIILTCILEQSVPETGACCLKRRIIAAERQRLFVDAGKIPAVWERFQCVK